MFENNIVGAINRDGMIDHAMILECILVKVDDDGEWDYSSLQFRFKNTDKDEKEIEIFVGTRFYSKCLLYLLLKRHLLLKNFVVIFC